MLNSEDRKFCEKCRYLSEIADYLGISKYTLRRWLTLLQEEGVIHNGKFRKYYRPNEVEKILENMK